MKKSISRIIGLINADYSHCIYNVCIESSGNEFPLEQYYYLVDCMVYIFL